MNKNILFLVIVVLSCSGCAALWDAPRNILGFSRRDMQAARVNSAYQVYQADPAEIFDAVVAECRTAGYYIFTKDEIRGFIALMGIPGVVDTTEVGVFITPLEKGQGVKVELSSRSTPAKRTVAAVLYSKLAEQFRKK